MQPDDRDCLMDASLLFDPLFRLPFIVGLLLAITLPLLGALLRLRDEWLAALGLAHLAAATGLAGLALHIPVVVGGAVGAVLGALGKAMSGSQGNSAYAFMILIGWCLTLLIAANTVLGSAMGHALVDGQLYFAGPMQLVAVGSLALVSAMGLPWLIPRLLRARFFPRNETANRLPAWRWHLGFDLLVALGMAVGVGTVGLMGAFALVFLAPWMAFRLAPSWKWTLGYSVGLAVLGYLVAFILALMTDQPFGPVLVAVLLALAMLVEFKTLLVSRRAIE
jgi:zinc transport system permease protein